MRIFYFLISLSFITVTTISDSKAQTINWRSQLAGLDGVAITCVTTTREAYSQRICNELSQRAQDNLLKNGVAVVFMGHFFKDEAQPAVPAQLKRPLHIKFDIGGTTGEIIALLIRAEALIRYKGAVEAGVADFPRVGDLILWQDRAVGDGPPNALTPAIIENMKGKLDTLLAHLQGGWQRAQ